MRCDASINQTPTLRKQNIFAINCLRNAKACAMIRSVDSDNNQTEETNMSIENAILELAAAIRYAADKNTVPVLGNSLGHASAIATLKTDEALLAEMEKAATKVETDAKAKQEKVMALVEADRKSAAKQAVADALAKAEAEKKAKVEEDDQLAGDPLDTASLDWDKDVRPALLAVGKDRDALVKLMAKYDVPKGGKAPNEKWADLLAEANAIVAARG